MALTKAQLVDLNANELIIDLDADTSITADTDDQIDIKIAGADDFTFTANTFTALSGSSIVVPASGLTIGSTAVTSTAAELNLLDGVSGLVQADLTKLAAVDSTAAELNIVDGGTSATSTTVADADRVVLNDNGTMVQVAVTDLSAYFDDEITAMPNLVTTAATTVGALDSGSITSGFGAIDNGTSNIRSATITAETAFVPDAANGASLGTTSLEFADLYLHDGAQILWGADQDVLLTHVADAGLSLKTSATGDDTKATLTLQTGETDIAANDVLGAIDFQAPDEGTGTDAILVAAGISAVSEGDFSSSNNATKLSFKTAASEAAAEKMSLSSAGVLTTSSNIVSGGNVVIADAGNIGSASDTDALAISSGGVVTFSQKPVINSGVTIDNITIDGTEIDLSSGDLTVDVAGDITLDADGADVNVADGGTTFGQFTNSSSDFVINAAVQDKDIIFKGDDGGSAITSLTLDMSNSGAAVFSAAAYNAEATLTDASTVTWNAITQPVCKVTLGGNRTIGLASGGVAGAFISILVIQDGTGSRTVSWNAAYEFAEDTAPTLTTTASKGDLFVFRYNGSKWLEVGRNLALTLS